MVAESATDAAEKCEKFYVNFVERSEHSLQKNKNYDTHKFVPYINLYCETTIELIIVTQ